jgi:hypothetical protein
MTPASLPAELQARIERLLDARLLACRRAEGGYTPATRLVCDTSRGACFVKIGATPLTARFIRRETRTRPARGASVAVYGALRGDFMPRLIAAEDHEHEPIFIIEDLSTHDWPPPWDHHKVDRVRAQIEAMHAAPAGLEAFAQVLNAIVGGWSAVAADPQPFLSLGIADQAWLDAALPALVAAEARCPTEGEALCHWDLRSDNLCLSSSRVLFVDWNLACRSNPALDLGFWLPSLEYEGGPAPERLLPNAPEVAAWVSGFFAARAGRPGIPDAPRVRLVQRQQLSTALPWAIRALGLPPVTIPTGWA